MILFEGNLLQDEELDSVLERLWNSCLEAIENREDIAQKAINACETVARKIRGGDYDMILQTLVQKGTFTKAQMEEVLTLFDRENLQRKYEIELGNFKADVENATNIGRTKYVEPLGILFHIAAGNAEGLPFYSVLEGLLSGNVNILKLPSMDDGVSIMLLHEMIKEEPVLAPYVCVLDVPSTNLGVMKKLADMADGIVVWGGDEAIKTIRTYAEPRTNIISWGHKLSFAYVTEDVLQDEKLQQELYALAHHICATRQVLCSSCQGLYVDTEKQQVVEGVGEKFFSILKEVSKEYAPEAIGIRGKIGISLYNEEKGLAQELMKAGVVRITRGGDMSKTVVGEAHDGEYPLRRYTKIVEVG